MSPEEDSGQKSELGKVYEPVLLAAVDNSPWTKPLHGSAECHSVLCQDMCFVRTLHGNGIGGSMAL